MIHPFERKLMTLVIDSMSNNHTDNYDYYRFGDKVSESFSLRDYLKKRYVFKKFIPKNRTLLAFEECLKLLELYGEKLNYIFDSLENESSKELLIQVIAYRIMGEEKIKLPANTPEFWKQSAESFNYADKNDTIDLNFLHWKLFKVDYRRYNLDLKMYSIPQSIVEYCYLGHYFYESKERKVSVDTGDYVLDCGGCYGDTSLMFSKYAGNEGKVFGFEFIPSNVKIFEKNISLNPEVRNVIIVQNPVWEVSDLKLFYKDNGPGSIVTTEPIENYDGIVATVTIDDFVDIRALPKVSFIKMDIEGSELPALKGAEKTLRRFKPKLAISIYHSMDDFVNIPAYILGLDLNYKLYLGHYTIHSEETVIYAIAD